MAQQSEQIKDLILSSSVEDLQLILPSIHFYYQQSDANEKNIIGTINQLINATKTRIKGFKILNEVIFYCSSEIIAQNASTWMEHCINNHAAENLKEIYFKTLVNILKVCNNDNFNNNNKKVVLNYMLDIMKMCLNSSNLNVLWAMDILSFCLQKYSTWFGNHRAKIEGFILKFLDNGSEQHVRKAAELFHYSSQIGGAGHDNAIYTSNFLSNFKKICTTIQSLFDVFFEQFQDNPTVKNETGIEFAPLPIDASPVKILDITTRRILNCLIYLKTMFLKSYSTTKQFVPKTIVEIFNRGLGVHICYTQQQISLEKQHFSMCLNRIQIGLMKCLSCVFKGYVSTMLPYSHAITKLLDNTLKRIHNCICFDNHSLYKKICYKTLNQWILSTRMYKSSDLKIIVQSLLNSCAPLKRNIKLDITTKEKIKNDTKNMNKTIGLKHQTKEVCSISLMTLENLIMVTTIPYPLLHEIVVFVMKIVADIQRNITILPYDNIECQIHLYQVLIAILKQRNASSFPIHGIVKLLNFGLSNSNFTISKICNDGITICEKITQPISCSIEINIKQNNQEEQMTVDDAFVEDNSKIHEDNFNIIETAEEKEEKQELNSDKQEIKILSDVVVTVPTKSPPVVEENVVVNGDHETIEVDDDVIEKEEEIKTNGVSKIEETIEIIEDDHKIIATEKKKLNPFHEDNIIENEPPVKRKKDGEADVDDMFSSFQDVVYE